MRTLVIGDIHGRDVWKTIISVEKWDKVVFLGDYFDSFDPITPATQIVNYKDIMALKSDYGDENVRVLLGNHDFHYMMENYRIRYSGWNMETQNMIKGDGNPIYRDYMSCRLELFYDDGDFIYSHAGISRHWLNYVKRFNMCEFDGHIENIEPNMLNDGLLDLLGWEPHGDSIFESPIWIRPDSLCSDHAIETFLLSDECENYLHDRKQIVGHTEWGWGRALLANGMDENALTAVEASKPVKYDEQGRMFSYDQDCDAWLYVLDSLPFYYGIVEDGKLEIVRL